MTHRVGVVTYKSNVHAWVLDLPGCIAGGRDVAEVGPALDLAILEHVAWLGMHGESVDEAYDWQIVETLPAAEHGGDACFAAEATPPSHEDLDVAIRRMKFARADLVASIDSLPPLLLDWEPPATAFASFDAWAPEPRSIRALVDHVLSFEVYYRDALQNGAAGGISTRVADAAADRAVTVGRLRSLTDDDRARVWRPIRPGHTEPEEWTVRKVLRRIISHERAHTAEIVQRRTWPLLGVPVLS